MKSIDFWRHCRCDVSRTCNFSVEKILLLTFFPFVVLIFSDVAAQGSGTPSCPSGTFGSLCNGTCHCLNGPTVCDPLQGYCTDYQCDRGWGNTPYCQTACTNNTFGSNCAKQCHCSSTSTCDIVNGYCNPNGICDPSWGGTACQTRLPKLSLPPVVQNITCVQLNVLWKPWNYVTDVGTAVVASYTVQERQNYTVSNMTSQWLNVQTVPSNNLSQEYICSVNIDDPYTYLEFQIVTNWNDIGKVFPGLPGPESSIVWPIVKCIVTTQLPTTSQRISTIDTTTTQQIITSTTTTTPTTTTTTATTTTAHVPTTTPDITTTVSILPTTTTTASATTTTALISSTTAKLTTTATVPGTVTSITTSLVPGTSSLVVSWSPPSNVPVGLINYNISYGIVGIGDCDNTFIGPWTTQLVDPATQSYTIGSNVPWRRYLVTLSASNVAGEGQESSVNFFSQEILPTGSVTNFTTLQLTSRDVTVQWSNVSCPLKGGQLLSFEVTVNDSNGARNVTQNSISLHNLIPFTTYAVTVRYFNHVGPGPVSTQFLFTTLADVPPPPTNVMIIFATDTLLQVTWSPPVPPNGIIQQYRIIYYLNGQTGSTTQTTLNALQTTYNITGLTPHTSYCVQVQCQTGVTFNNGWGNTSNPICNTTSDGLPTPPVNLQGNMKNETCISVQWSPPAVTNGQLISYKITYTSISKPNSGNGQTFASSSQFQQLICDLNPDVQYSIQVQASTSQGFGPSATVNIWTDISTPEPPLSPQLLSVQDTTATIAISPAVLSNGPLSGYFIVVSSLDRTGKRRRKRALPDPVQFLNLQGYTAAQLGPNNVTQTLDFVVGDNNSYGGYWNQPLQFQRWYGIYYVVASSRDGTLVKMSYSQTPSFETGSQLTSVISISSSSQGQTSATPAPIKQFGLSAYDQGVAIGVSVFLLILLLLLALLLLYCCWWKRRKDRSTDEDQKNSSWLQYFTNHYNGLDNNTSPTKQRKWNEIYSLEDTRHVLKDNKGPSDLNINDIHDNRPTISFEDEYRKLPVGSIFPTTVAQRPENADKNRFDHLLAYDHTRVKLIETSADGSDYFNANYVPGYDRRRKAYIAAQSPFNESTICDFWLMVYGDNVTKIVFLAKLIEDAIVKSEQYWCDDSDMHQYGSVTVTLLAVENYANFIVRTFSVAKIGQFGSRKVTQYQYTAWPEHGTPRDPISLLEFRDKVQTCPDSPLVVHCGTGVSRSAVYIAIDFCLKRAEIENCVNVFRCCSSMRQCRPMMVRTLKQYIFLYDALFEALIATPLLIDGDVKAVYHDLKRINPKTNASYFKEQFAMLEKYLDAPSEGQCKSAMSDENRVKNRFSTLRLVTKDCDLIPLRSDAGPTTRRDYINALTVDSYTESEAFIVTQTPLATTVADFWKLIYDFSVACIVSVNGNEFKEDTCVDYWPTVEKVVQKADGGFFVTLLSLEQTEHVTIRTLRIARDGGGGGGAGRLGMSSTADDAARIVKQFQFQSWKMYEQVPWSSEGFLQMVDLVAMERNDSSLRSLTATGARRRLTSPPTVVHCIDGASQSGLFCAAYIVCQKMKIDRQVDVFHSVKHMRNKRFHFVNSLEQYKFCFRLLWDFVNTRLTSTTA